MIELRIFMKTAIIFMSKHGTTAKISENIKTELVNDEVQIFNLKENKPNDLNKFEMIIIGGSIHAGSMHTKLRKFITSNMNILLSKKIALFLVCMDKTEKRTKQFNIAFPAELRKKSIANGFMGGEFCFDKMNFVEKAIIKKISGKSENVSELDEEALEDFIRKLIN
jgi:menaquinone-dependent protoporphyrinogen oxidase